MNTVKTGSSATARKRVNKAAAERRQLLDIESPLQAPTPLEKVVFTTLKKSRIFAKLYGPFVEDRTQLVNDPTPRPGSIVHQDIKSHNVLFNPAYLAELNSHGLVQVKTFRFRPKGENFDRRFVVESTLDPLDNNSVILRVRPVSRAGLPDPQPELLTTQEAAGVLGVSRPYVAKLFDEGKFRGAQRTNGGQRRIPAPEVQRVLAEMRTVQHRSLERMEDLTAELRTRELADAKKKSTRRWVAKQA